MAVLRSQGLLPAKLILHFSAMTLSLPLHIEILRLIAHPIGLSVFPLIDVPLCGTASLVLMSLLLLGHFRQCSTLTRSPLDRPNLTESQLEWVHRAVMPDTQGLARLKRLPTLVRERSNRAQRVHGKSSPNTRKPEEIQPNSPHQAIRGRLLRPSRGATPSTYGKQIALPVETRQRRVSQ